MLTGDRIGKGTCAAAVAEHIEPEIAAAAFDPLVVLFGPDPPKTMGLHRSEERIVAPSSRHRRLGRRESAERRQPESTDPLSLPVRSVAELGAPPTVRAAYYQGFDPALNDAFATYGIGWHYETGVELLRLILGGVFDRFPDLQVIVGHWGEMVLFYLDRIDALRPTATLARPPSDYVRNNVFVTPSGIFSHRYLRWAIEVVGVERILFSTDYPFGFAPRGGARRFLEEADLDDRDRRRIASGNWEQLVAGIRR